MPLQVLRGASIPPQIGLRVERGNALLYRDARYGRNLAGARAGNLPFTVVTDIRLDKNRLMLTTARLTASVRFPLIICDEEWHSS